MGLRYRKSIRLGGVVRVNISGRGVGWSVGGNGVRHTDPGGRRAYRTLTIPGTGISYRSSSGSNAPYAQSRAPESRPIAVEARQRHPWEKWLLIAVVLLLIAAIPVAGPALFWVAVLGLVAGRILPSRQARGAGNLVTPSLAVPSWTPPRFAEESQGPRTFAAPPLPLHQTGLADTEHDAEERRDKTDELRRQLDELG